jgi:nucleotide-binding universal stress UspA family protein
MTVGDLVVVGVDGSEAGCRALRWALREAARRGSAVEVITAWSYPLRATAPMAPATGDDLAAAAKVAQDEAVAAELAALDVPAPTVSREVVEGDPVRVLARASTRAAFLVVGSHGHGLLRSALLGSVSEGCIRHATSPVVVVPAPHRVEDAASELAATKAGPAE